jgi:hypothetical protein
MCPPKGLWSVDVKMNRPHFDLAHTRLNAISWYPRSPAEGKQRERERETSIFFRGYRYALRDQDTT